MAPSVVVPLARAIATGRPCTDPGCAGCPQLATLRALRRAGLDVEGRLGCDPLPPRASSGGGVRRARVIGVREVLAAGPAAALPVAGDDGVRLTVIADRLAHGRLATLEARLAGAGVASVRLDPDDVRGVEAAVRAAAETPGAVLLSLSPCVRGAPHAAPFAVDPSRCNRCGGCLTLACPAIADPGGEAMEVDPEICTGCGRCAPLCRSGALAQYQPSRIAR